MTHQTTETRTPPSAVRDAPTDARLQTSPPVACVGGNSPAGAISSRSRREPIHGAHWAGAWIMRELEKAGEPPMFPYLEAINEAQNKRDTRRNRIVFRVGLAMVFAASVLIGLDPMGAFGVTQ